MRVLDQHEDVVTALAWLPNGSGFISGGLDRKIMLWVRHFPSPFPSLHLFFSLNIH